MNKTALNETALNETALNETALNETALNETALNETALNEIELTFRNEGLSFAGTLTLPEGQGPFPALLMIAGSGPVDRNEDHKRMPLGVFRKLAAFLARLGVASFRYDKRGVGASEGDYWTCGFHQTRGDAKAAFNTLASRDEVDPNALLVLGHSEGALHASGLAAEGLPITGLILLGGLARSLEECLLWQGRAVVESLTGVQAWLIKALRVDPGKQQRKMIERIRRSDRDVLRVQLVNKLNARWFREALDADPAEDLSRLQCPTLAITGSEDVQTPPEDLERMRTLNPEHIETALIPKMSHLLRRSERRGVQDYKRQLQEELAPELLEAIEAWITRRPWSREQAVTEQAVTEQAVTEQAVTEQAVTEPKSTSRLG